MSPSNTFSTEKSQTSLLLNDAPISEDAIPDIRESSLEWPSSPASGRTTHEGQYASSISSGPRPHTDHTRRLSANMMSELTERLPITTLPNSSGPDIDERPLPRCGKSDSDLVPRIEHQKLKAEHLEQTDGSDLIAGGSTSLKGDQNSPYQSIRHYGPSPGSPRTLLTPPISREVSSNQGQTEKATARRHSYNPLPRPPPLNLDNAASPSLPPMRASIQIQKKATAPTYPDPRLPSPIPPSIPLPPLSLPTMLQLELAGHRPNPLYIHHSYASEIPYESSAVKFERLKNFLLLPTYLERTINFGALACLDAWLWTLTILPLRFCIALGVLARWWAYLVGKETRWVITFVWGGLGRMWQRGCRGQPPRRPNAVDDDKCFPGKSLFKPEVNTQCRKNWCTDGIFLKRNKSTPRPPTGHRS